VALTARDAERLRALSGAPLTVHHVPAPFPTALPAAGERLDGAPAVVVLGGGWLPNRDGAAWFASAVWPHVRARCPGAVLHLFGSAPRRRGRGIVRHPSPVDSAAAFAPGAILAVPLRIASGVRIKILEAWARGVPVVATPEAAAGLEATDGVELLIARDPAGFAAAIHRLDADPAFARASVDAGRARLGAHHDPRRIAGRLVDVYTDVAGRRRRVGIDAG
jgi:glycosyltransferase involved in cell wall biosynthesis